MQNHDMAADAKRASRPHPEQTVKCPRCNSPETKFCYYNNYSTTQPRYFCKNCKRYWTDGGTLRNVPVGGGLRRNKRSKSRLGATPSPSPSPSPTPSSLLMPSDNVCAANHSIAGHSVFLNPNAEHANLGLPPHTPNYLLFCSPRNSAMDLPVDPISNNHFPFYQPELAISPHATYPFPSHVEAAGLQTDPTLSGGYFYAHPLHLKEQEVLQAGGYSPRNEKSSLHYISSSFANGNEMFAAGGDANYALLQRPQAPQWTDFHAGARSL